MLCPVSVAKWLAYRERLPRAKAGLLQVLFTGYWVRVSKWFSCPTRAGSIKKPVVDLDCGKEKQTTRTTSDLDVLVVRCWGYKTTGGQADVAAAASSSFNLNAIYLNNNICPTAQLGHTRFTFSLCLNFQYLSALIIMEDLLLTTNTLLDWTRKPLHWCYVNDSIPGVCGHFRLTKKMRFVIFFFPFFFLTCQTTPWRVTEGVRAFRFLFFFFFKKKATWTMGILSHFYLFFLVPENGGESKNWL